MFTKDIKDIADMTKILENIDIIYKRKNTIDKILLLSHIEKFKNIQIIFGPSSVVLYKINNKPVLFFQDVHQVPEQSCYIKNTDKMWITDFLKELFLFSPVCIDFFHETATFMQVSKEKRSKKRSIKSLLQNLIYAKELEREMGIEKLWKEFADCLGPIKTGCQKYKKVRFHNVEFRRFNENFYDFSAFNSYSIFGIPFYYMYVKKNEKAEYPYNIDAYIKDNKKIGTFIQDKYDDVVKDYIDNKISLYENILTALLDGDMTNLSKTILAMHQQFIDKNIVSAKMIDSFSIKGIESSPYPKLAKQFTPLSPNITLKIKTFIMNEYTNKISPLINKLKQMKKDQESIYNLIFNEDRQKSSIRLINQQFAVIVFDAYTLSRMMKSIYVYDSSIIIMYAGQTHTETYSKFFKGTFDLKEIIKIEESKGEACINLLKLQDKWKIIINTLMEQFTKEQTCDIKEGIILEKL